MSDRNSIKVKYSTLIYIFQTHPREFISFEVRAWFENFGKCPCVSAVFNLISIYPTIPCLAIPGLAINRYIETGTPPGQVSGQRTMVSKITFRTYVSGGHTSKVLGPDRISASIWYPSPEIHNVFISVPRHWTCNRGYHRHNKTASENP